MEITSELVILTMVYFSFLIPASMMRIIVFLLFSATAWSCLLERAATVETF